MGRRTAVPVALAAALTLLLAGCSGVGDVEGEWQATGEGEKERVVVDEEGRMTFPPRGLCSGTLEPDGDHYAVEVDCGMIRATGTARLSGGGDTLTIQRTGGGDPQVYQRVE